MSKGMPNIFGPVTLMGGGGGQGRHMRTIWKHVPLKPKIWEAKMTCRVAQLGLWKQVCWTPTGAAIAGDQELQAIR